MSIEEIKISHLKRREIQAPLVSAIIKKFVEEFGYDKTIELIKDVIRKDAVESGKLLEQKYSGNSIQALSKIVSEVWANDDAMEICNIKEGINELSFDVVNCKYAELYESLGVKGLGCILSCIRDY